MSEPADHQALFDGLIASLGGLERLSAVDVEVVTVVCKLLVAIRNADGAEVPKIAATISQLQASLPAPVAVDEKPLDLSKLSDEQFHQLEIIAATARGEAAPPPLAVAAERVRGPSEIAAEQLGRWCDDHRDDLRFRGLTADEENHLRVLFQSIAGPSFIPRNLWRSIYQSELETQIEAAVRSALSAVGSDARILSRDEQKAIEPPPPRPPVVTPLNGVEFCAQFNSAGRR